MALGNTVEAGGVGGVLDIASIKRRDARRNGIGDGSEKREPSKAQSAYPEKRVLFHSKIGSSKVGGTRFVYTEML